MQLRTVLEATAKPIISEPLKKAVFDFIAGRCEREVGADFEDEYDGDETPAAFFNSAFDQHWEEVTADDIGDEHELKNQLDEAGVDDETLNRYVDSIKNKVKTVVRTEMKNLGHFKRRRDDD